MPKDSAIETGGVALAAKPLDALPASQPEQAVNFENAPQASEKTSETQFLGNESQVAEKLSDILNSGAEGQHDAMEAVANMDVNERVREASAENGTPPWDPEMMEHWRQNSSETQTARPDDAVNRGVKLTEVAQRLKNRFFPGSKKSSSAEITPSSSAPASETQSAQAPVSREGDDASIGSFPDSRGEVDEYGNPKGLYNLDVAQKIAAENQDRARHEAVQKRYDEALARQDPNSAEASAELQAAAQAKEAIRYEDRARSEGREWSAPAEITAQESPAAPMAGQIAQQENQESHAEPVQEQGTSPNAIERQVPSSNETDNSAAAATHEELRANGSETTQNINQGEAKAEESSPTDTSENPASGNETSQVSPQDEKGRPEYIPEKNAAHNDKESQSSVEASSEQSDPFAALFKDINPQVGEIMKSVLENPSNENMHTVMTQILEVALQALKTTGEASNLVTEDKTENKDKEVKKQNNKSLLLMMGVLLILLATYSVSSSGPQKK